MKTFVEKLIKMNNLRNYIDDAIHFEFKYIDIISKAFQQVEYINLHTCITKKDVLFLENLRTCTKTNDLSTFKTISEFIVQLTDVQSTLNV